LSADDEDGEVRDRHMAGKTLVEVKQEGLQQWKPEIGVDAMGPIVSSIAAMAAELHAN